MIKSEYIEMIRKDGNLRAKIMLVTGKSMATVYRWLQYNAEDLTTADVMRVVCDHLKIKQSDILEPAKKITV